MLQNLKKRNEGFTIIEVLIVLAIVGLIMLIVFLAVPALQRNSRNTSIKNDVQNVLGGVAEFQAANGGSMPTSVSGTGTVTYAGTTPVTTRVQGSTQVVNQTGAVPTSGAGPASGTINVYVGRTCANATNARAVAATYSIETSGNPNVLQCVDS